MSSSPLRIIFAGSGEFGLPTLRALVDGGGHEFVQVVSQPDRPAGRGRGLTPTPIAAFALERGLPLVRTENINGESLPPADLLVVIAFGQKIAPPVVDHPRFGGINLHASRLPKYRGAAPINWAIMRGETVTGNSVIRLAQRMDAGAILGQSELRIGETETAGELHDRLAQDGAPLMLRVIDQLAAGTAVERSQDEAQATLAPKLSRDASRLDWNHPAVQIVSQIRGMYPWPACRAELTGAERPLKVTLVRARATDTRGGEPSTVEDSGAVAAGDGAVEILEIHPEGKRPMSLASFRNGHPWRAGMRLVPIA